MKPAKGNKKKARKNSWIRGVLRRGAILLCAMVMSVAGLGVYAAARYVINDTTDAVADPADFVFISSCADNTSGAAYNVYSGTISLSVSNTDGVNNGVDVTYAVSVYEDGALLSSQPSIAIDNANVASGSLTSSNRSDNIVISGLADGTYTVQVSATSPYTKTLAAQFALASAGASSFYHVTDNGSWVSMELFTGNTGGNITVNYDASKLAPDNTNGLMSSWTSGTGTVSDTLSGLSPHAHYTLVFFENTAGTYAVGDTIISNSTITMPAGT